jgi:hypothetical protein
MRVDAMPVPRPAKYVTHFPGVVGPTSAA